MKYRLMLFLLMVQPALAADSVISKQFTDLQAARAAEIQQRDQQYLAKLKLLFERSKVVSDMEGKSLVGTEMEKITAAMQAAAVEKGTSSKATKITNAHELSVALLSSSGAEWLNRNGSVYDKFSFLPDGKLKVPGSMAWLSKWEATGADEFRIYHQDGFYWFFKFSEETGFAKSVKKRGAAQDESKAVRLLREK
ncbi:MAG: hypothetical protein EOP87_03845 [Verrucomicrobiaceae bacterium]|nr:MAG: hypothetical protein EOP87_03845 [Verrucomicrobiaceae bacterium]